jgi:hypothetical protein
MTARKQVKLDNGIRQVMDAGEITPTWIKVSHKLNLFLQYPKDVCFPANKSKYRLEGGRVFATTENHYLHKK